MGSSCSTNTGSATTSVKGAGSMDKFVQPVTVMKGEKRKERAVLGYLLKLASCCCRGKKRYKAIWSPVGTSIFFFKLGNNSHGSKKSKKCAFQRYINYHIIFFHSVNTAA